jgi:hypothetical protein
MDKKIWRTNEQFFSSLGPFLANFEVWTKTELQSAVKDRKPVPHQKVKCSKARNQYIMIIQLIIHDTYLCTSKVKHHNRRN